MSRRLAVITEIIAPYRIPVFNALATQPGIDLHVVFLAETDPSLRDWHIYGNEMHFSYQVLPSWRRRIGRHSVLLNRGLKHALKAFGPDIVVCGGYNYLASWQALAWAKWHGVPFVSWVESTCREPRHLLFPVEMVKRSFLRACSGYLVPGKASATYLASLGARREKIAFAPNAVDLRLFAKGAEQARRDPEAIRARFGLPSRFFLFVGRLVEAKGIFDLLDAYAQLPPEIRDQIGLVYAGDGVARTELVRRAAQLKPGSIRLLGFLQRDELPCLYALAEALVFPTRSDVWGLVVNEAMACGLPVIATDVAGCREDLLHHGQNALLVRPGDVAALAHCMQRLLSNPELRREMGRRSAELITRYSPENCAAGFASLYFTTSPGAAKWKPVA